MYNASIGSPVAPPSRPLSRRTQAERRARTRNALLDATIECLAEHGYSQTTTRRIAERAGVTSGAVQHHFAGKRQLVEETMRRVTERFAREMLAEAPESTTSEQERNELLLDRMWELHKGPLFEAGMELLVAARTEPALRGSLLHAQAEIASWIEEGGPVLYPQLALQPGFLALLASGQAMMRGLALMTFASDSDPDQAWLPARSHLLMLLAAFNEHTESHR